MSDLMRLRQMIRDYVEERDWDQFHNPKDLTISLALESSELLEHFQWKTTEEIEDYLVKSKHEVEEELADVFYCVLLIANKLDVDLEQVLSKKMIKNRNKYPIEKARGNYKKYTELAD